MTILVSCRMGKNISLFGDTLVGCYRNNLPIGIEKASKLLRGIDFLAGYSGNDIVNYLKQGRLISNIKFEDFIKNYAPSYNDRLLLVTHQFSYTYIYNKLKHPIIIESKSRYFCVGNGSKQLKELLESRVITGNGEERIKNAVRLLQQYNQYGIGLPLNKLSL